MLKFELADVNMHEIELLNHICITIYCDTIKDENLMNYVY